MPIYRRVLAYYRPYLGPTLLAVALTLVATGFNLLKPWPLKYIIDLLTGTTRLEDLHFLGLALDSTRISEALLVLAGLTVVFHLLGGLLGVYTTMLFVRVGLQGLLCLRTELYAYLQSLPLKFHDQRRSGDSSFRVAYDSQAIQTIYSKGTFIFQAAVTLLSTFLVLWALQWGLALLSLAVIPFMVGAIYVYSKRIRKESTIIQERESGLLSVTQEGLSSIRIVQAFGREEYEVAQFRQHAHASLEANMQLTGTSMKSSLVVSTIMAITTAAVYFLGAKHVLNETLKPGDLWVISAYLLMLYAPLEALTYLVWALEGAAAGATRCFEVLDRENEVKEAPAAREITHSTGAIAFEGITFGYAPERKILENVNLHVAPGETVAIVGSTGAGKSTLLSLVPRFYDPMAGRVLLDGMDIRRLTKKSLRTQISIVLQDTVLFSTTIRENIAYGRPDAGEAEIIEAAKCAQAHEFIMALPDGYRSQVGERGGHLSVGQRQRIGIARAFLKDAPILLLDEPTSALDHTTEAAIMQTIGTLMAGRTTLIVTHRLGTVHRMQKIVVLGPGGIVEQGSGPELVARGGVYAQLYHSAHLSSVLPAAD